MNHPFNQGNPNKNIRVIHYIRVRSLPNPSSNEPSALSIISVFAHFQIQVLKNYPCYLLYPCSFTLNYIRVQFLSTLSK